MSKIFLDTETCGLHGMIVLIQYAVKDGEIILYEPWRESISKTLELIEWFCQNDMIMFNSAYDWFHLTKMYNTFRLVDHDWLPQDHIDDIAIAEEKARDGLCLKPVGTLDLMLHARKGPYQSTMDRSDVRIKKVPVQIAHLLSDELNKKIRLPDIYFERSPTKQQWHILDRDDEDEFKDVCLMFKPSSALKALAVDALGIKDVAKFKDIELDKRYRPKEVGYAPFAMAGWKDKKGKWHKPQYLKGLDRWMWDYTWPTVIIEHIKHWHYNSRAREYAKNDIVYTRGLYHYFNEPHLNDDDSILACMVGTIRWSGYKVDLDAVKRLNVNTLKTARSCKFRNSPPKVMEYITEEMDDVEKLVMDSTKKLVLETISVWRDHPAATRALLVLNARKASKECELYEKLFHAGRFHASFKVIGTLSTRMAGSDGLNPQGIKRTKEVRECFPFVFDKDSYALCGGDFDAFEMALMDAVYNDPKMHEELCSDKKIHGIWGHRYFFKDLTYDQILASKGVEPDYYVRSKNGVFAICYFGQGYTLITRVGMTDEQEAEDAYNQILIDYPVFAEKRRDIVDKFCSMTQPSGIGTKVIWAEPDDYVESMFGFRRYFTLENKICKVLFDLAQDPPEEWKSLKTRIVRRDREQTVYGATQSALYGAAFQIQGSNMRAAGNHRIQSSGAQITKKLQRNIWSHQPTGINPFMVKPFNAHDEVLTPTHKSIVDDVAKTVKQTIESYRDKVPLINMEWSINLQTWADK